MEEMKGVMKINKQLILSIIVIGIVASLYIITYEPQDLLILESSLNEFHSEETNFSVIMPGNVERSIVKFDSEYGKIEVIVFKSNPTRNFEFSVTYNEYPEEMVETYISNNFLDDVVNSVKKNSNSELLEKKDIIHNGHDGIEAILELESGFIMKLRMFLVDNKRYHIYVLTREQKSDYAVIDTFFNSFKIHE